ncbi:MAG: HNH endonuclease signature motif containing protein [Chloroflexota bacterium]
MSYVSTDLRRLVIERANNCCEYCLFPQSASLLTFEMEHIISEKHGGQTEDNNLALACPYCNRGKGSDLGSLDTITGFLTPFFNPRTQNWQEHFYLDGTNIVPLTAEGRVTASILQLNEPDRLQERQQLINAGQFPIN